jgi:uncharacterized protein involved in outer membrane biogenesis
MSWLFKLLLYSLAAIVLAVSLAFFSFQLADQHTRRDWLVSLVESVPGVSLELGEDFQWKMGTRLSLRTRDVKLHVDDQHGDLKLKATMLDVTFPLFPMVFGRLEPDINGQAITGSLKLSPSDLSKETVPSRFKLYPGNIDLSNIRFTLQYEGSDSEVRVDKLLFVHQHGDFRLFLAGKYDDLPLRLESKRVQPNLIEVTGKLANVDILAKGSVDFMDETSLPRLDLDVQMNAPNLDFSGKGPGSLLSLPGPVTLTAKLHADNTWELSRIVFHSENKHLKIHAEGEITDLFAMQGADVSWSVRAEDLAAVLKSGKMGGEAFLKGKLQARGRLQTADGRLSVKDIEATLQRKGLRMNMSGLVGDLLELKGAHLKLSLVADSLKTLGLANVASNQPTKITGQLDSVSGKADLALKIEGRGKGWMLQVRGDVATKGQKMLPLLDVSLTADNLSLLGDMAGLELQPVNPVRGKFKASLRRDRLSLEDIDLLVGESDLRGNLNILLGENTTGGKTSGHLYSRLLDTKAMFPDKKSKKLEVIKNAEVESVLVEKEKTTVKIFSDRALSFDGIKDVSLDIQLDVEEFRGPNMEAHDVKMPVAIQRGILQMGAFSATMGGRPLNGLVKLDVNTELPRYRLSLSVENMDVAAAFPRVRLEKGQSRMWIEVDVTGMGSSIAQMAASMNGEVLLGLKDYPVGSGLPEKLGESILETINPIKDNNKNILQCGAAYFSIKEGLATTPRGIAAVFDQAAWLGQGTLNLSTENIVLSLKPYPRKGFGLQLLGVANLVMLGGSLSSPTLLVDPKGAIGTYISYAAAVSTGGASLLVEGLLKQSRANEDVCDQILTGSNLSREKGGKLPRESRDSGEDRFDIHDQ